MSERRDRRRWATNEQRLADSCGTERVKNRPRYMPAPDCLPVRLETGHVIQPEAKSRKKLPQWLYDAIDQAEGYTPGAIALVGLYQKGSSEALAVLRLNDLLLLLGLRPAPAGSQLSLARSA